MKKLVDIEKIIYADSSTNLVLLGLKTNTCTFPLAIRNDAKNICVAFNGNTSLYKGRSLRKGTSSLNAYKEIRISHIFSKKVEEKYYDCLVYTRSVKSLNSTFVDYKTILHPKLILRFSFITNL